MRFRFRQFLALSVVAALWVPQLAFAQATGGTAPAPARASITTANTGLDAAAANTGLSNACQGAQGSACVARIMGGLINIVLSLVGFLLLFYLLYGGILWMTSGGDTEGVQKAKTMIQNAVVGMIILGASFAISSFVLSQLATAFGEPAASAPEAPASPGP